MEYWSFAIVAPAFQPSLQYYVHLLAAAAHLLGLHKTGGLQETFAATIIVLMILYPLCRWYGQIKETLPRGILRYL